MTKNPRLEPSEPADDCLTVGDGEYAIVKLYGEAKDEYKALKKRNDQTSIREARTLSRYFERFAKLGSQSLDDTMFKSQKRINSGGTSVMIWEFKAYQFRVYGAIGEDGKKRCFFGTACDPSKKQQKADPQRLQKAADEYVRIIS